MTQAEYASASGVKADTLSTFLSQSPANITSNDVRAKILRGLVAQAERFRKPGPEIAVLLERTHDAALRALLSGRRGIADRLLERWWYLTGKQPLNSGQRSTMRRGETNTPPLRDLLALAQELQLVPEEHAQRPWESPAFQQAEVEWRQESIETIGRSSAVTEAIIVLELAGFPATGEGLENFAERCAELGIDIPDPRTVKLSAEEARSVAAFQPIEFVKIEPLLRIAGDRIGRPDMTARLRDNWEMEWTLAEDERRLGVRIRELAKDQRWTNKELSYVLGLPYKELGDNNPIWDALHLRGRHMPLRSMLAALGESREEVRTLDGQRAQGYLARRRARGNQRMIPSVRVIRMLWGLSAQDISLDADELTKLENGQQSALDEDDVHLRLAETGEQRTRDMLLRWLERRELRSARDIMLNLCERHRVRTGNGVPKLVKDVGCPDFHELHERPEMVMSVCLLRQMLDVMEGIHEIPPGLEAQHRLDRGDFLASEAGGALLPLQRLLETVVTERHRTMRLFHQDVGADEPKRRRIRRAFDAVKEEGTKIDTLRDATVTTLADAGHEPPAALTETAALVLEHGEYPAVLTALYRRWLAGDENQRAMARDLLGLARATEADETVVPQAAPTESLDELFLRRMRSMAEYDNRAWDEKDLRFETDRRRARVLRLLPGVTRGDLRQLAAILAAEPSHGVGPRPFDPDPAETLFPRRIETVGVIKTPEIPDGEVEETLDPPDTDLDALVGEWAAPELRLRVALIRLTLARTAAPAQPTSASAPLPAAVRLAMYAVLDCLPADCDEERVTTLCTEQSIPAEVLRAWRKRVERLRQPAVSEAPPAVDSEEVARLRAQVGALQLRLLKAVPDDVRGTIVRGAEVPTPAGRDPIDWLLDLLSAPLLNATAISAAYIAAADRIDVMGQVRLGTPLGDDLMYVQQFCTMTRGGRRDQVYGVIERLIPRLRQLRPQWEPSSDSSLLPSDPALFGTPAMITTQGEAQPALADEQATLRRERELLAAERAQLEESRRVLERDRQRITSEAERKDRRIGDLERLQREAEVQMRQVIEQRDTAQRELQRLQREQRRREREAEEADDAAGGGEEATVVGVGEATVVDGGGDEEDAATVYEPHPEDASGIAFDRVRSVELLGQYMRCFIGPDSAGYGLEEPEAASVARAAATRAEPTQEDLESMMRMLAYCYADPSHEGHVLLAARLRAIDSESEEALAEPIGRLARDARFRGAVLALAEEDDEALLVDLVTNVITLEDLAAMTEEDEDEDEEDDGEEYKARPRRDDPDDPPDPEEGPPPGFAGPEEDDLDEQGGTGQSLDDFLRTIGDGDRPRRTRKRRHA